MAVAGTVLKIAPSGSPRRTVIAFSPCCFLSHLPLCRALTVVKCIKLNVMKKKSVSTERSKKRGSNPDSSQNVWRLAGVVVLIAAGLLRLLYLTEKPLHHDEGVNGYFLTALFRHGFYHYNPANYHGPTLYYLGLLTTPLNSLVYGKYGLSTFAIRLVPALFGIGTVWLIL